MEMIGKRKKDPLCFIEVVDVPLGTPPDEIEQKVEESYASIQDACEEGKYIPLSTQQSVHTYSRETIGESGSKVIKEHIVFVITAHIISHEELSKRQRMQQLGGPNGGPRG